MKPPSMELARNPIPEVFSTLDKSDVVKENAAAKAERVSPTNPVDVKPPALEPEK